MATLIGDGSYAGRSGSTLSFATALGRLEVTACTPRIVRVRLRMEGFPDGTSYLAPRDWGPVEMSVSMGEPIVADTGAVSIRIETTPLRLSFVDAAGRLALRGLLADGVVRQAPAGGGAEAGSWRVTAAFEPHGEQHFYGLGEGGKQFDRLGSARQFWNTHIVRGPGSDIGVPLLLSTRGYALFFDDTSDGLLVVGRSDGGTRFTYSAERGRLDWYYLAGDDPRGALEATAELLGRASLPPRWALGYLQSTRHFDDTAEMMRLPRTLREKQIPCDALIFLSSYGDALGWNKGVGHLEFQPELWPEPAGILAEMRGRGFRVVTHEYPVLHEESPLHDEAVRNGYLLDDGYARVTPESRPTTNFQEGQRYIDFSHPGARSWWWGQHRALAELGVDGWWLDGGEGPAAATALHAGDGVALHNIYDQLRQQAFAEGTAVDFPDGRTFLLCRSGAAGMQRHGAWCWSGDINNTFATLEAQVPLGLNTALSGIPYWGTDIGGFFHPIPESGELYARWFQFGAFCPSFRSHGWVWREHLPWAHGPEIEAICRRYVDLRYRLFPYTYTLAWQAFTLGLPLMRPLVLNYPDDPNVWELGSQYLWGDDLLVAPVTREGATSWPVYLPAGGWYDYWTKQRYDGPRGVGVEAPLDRLPLFVRAGAILPLGPLMQWSDERPMDEITLLVYPEGHSRFDLYEDDGRTNAYRTGSYALTPIECDGNTDRVIVRIGEPAGDAAVIPANRSYTLQVCTGSPRRVTLEGTGELPRLSAGTSGDAGWWHDNHFTYIRTPSVVCTVTIDL